jgi:uroporphyrin-III C-methyltransferase
MANGQKISTLLIVGAGPGDAELITIKGLKAIQRADIILYDALASKELLLHAQAECKFIYVGKRRGKKAFSQDEINQLIVFYSTQYKTIVRLKGGDPFVFGRGHEEMEYALKRGMNVEVIPGISSALSGPASVGIPLTKRGVNESFWVITGTLSNGEISSDIYHASKSTATIVVLMGMSQLEKIMTIFKDGRSINEPVAIIQHATLPEQQSIKGTVGNIVKLAKENEIDNPAVIVIGKVVEESLIAEQVESVFKESVMRIAV